MPTQQESDHYVVLPSGRSVTNAMKADHADYSPRFVKGLQSNRKSTLDRGMRRSNRSIKHSKQWRTSSTERSALRYTTGG